MQRRTFLQGLGGSALLGTSLSLPGSAWANWLVPTPAQTEGPFYPARLPLDRDNDLLRVAGAEADPGSPVAHVMGRLLDRNGRAIPKARIEIWQCDAQGVYLDATGGTALDSGFQGYGATETDDEGAYRFRTIRPVPYGGRTPHIHFAVSGAGFSRLVTQLYVAGEAGNARDFVLNRIRHEKARQAVIADFEPAGEIEPGALAASFDIVLGETPGE
ncbi:MAG: protocatechuate 3,4-dioxygenase [Rhodovibrionaceae bacterium]